MGQHQVLDFQEDLIDEEYRAQGVVTLANGTVMSLHTLLIITSKLIGTPPSKINKHIPPVKSIRGRTCFQLLITVNCRPNCTANKLKNYVGSDSRVINKVIDRLLLLGFIQHTRRPRKMPIGAFVIDDTYRITSKGRSVLRKITGM